MKYVIGGVIVFCILVLAGIVYGATVLFNNAPSMNDAVNFVTDIQADVPALGEVIPADVLPFPVGDSETATGSTETPTTLPGTDAAPSWLTPEQITFLSRLGIDPADLPATLSPELELCLTAAVGAERFAEIKNGAVPTMIEGAKAVGCLAL